MFRPLKMNADPYEEWISIYNDEIKSIWKEERTELRKISMIYFAFENELNKLKDDLNNKMMEIKTKLKHKDCLQKCKNFVGLAQSECFEENPEVNKENETAETTPHKSVETNKKTNGDFLIESPNTSSFFENCSSPERTNVNVPSASPVSPVIRKHYISSKKKNMNSPSLVLYPVITHKVGKTLSMQRKSHEFKTPKSADDSNIMECSIIENTPDINFSKKSRSKMSLLKPKTSNKSRPTENKQKSTLTQMFSEDRLKKNKEIHTNGPSMSISEMINLINSSDSETEAELDQSETTIDNLDVSLNEPLKNEFQSFIENYDRVPEKNDKSPNFVYKEPVKGRERKKLKGWACQECETYYKGLDLPPEELEKRKDICSRHKHKFQPRDETYTGFWNLSFGPTPKTQDRDKSVLQNYKKL